MEEGEEEGEGWVEEGGEGWEEEGEEGGEGWEEEGEEVAAELESVITIKTYLHDEKD